MKTIFAIILGIGLSTHAYAVDSSTIKKSLDTAKIINVGYVANDIERAIKGILSSNPALQRRFTESKIKTLASAIAKASKITGVDWKIILAVSYVESRMCLVQRGDKKQNASGTKLFDFWSTGCMQVNLRWWGEIISDAGLKQQDLLDHEKSIIIGALILKHYIKQNGGDWDTGVKRYNGYGERAKIYQSKVLKIYKMIAML